MVDKGLKICVIGGGSTYTPELIEGFIVRSRELPVREIALMDVDEERLGIVGGLAGRMLRAAGAEIAVSLTTDCREALVGADYVITQLRVGGMAARVLDETIPLRFGVIGQETTGPGGFACALRTIPVLLEIARDVAQVAPEAHLINFTNPSGLVTEALLKHTSVPVIGLCNVPVGFQTQIAHHLGVPLDRLHLDYVGLNHLSWIRGLEARGEDVFPRVFAAYLDQSRTGEFPFSPELLETLGLIPSYYLRYYYHHDLVLEEQLRAGKQRAQEVLEIEADLLKLYGDPGLVTKPKLLDRRGGAHYSTAAVGLISAMHNDKGETHILNVRNDGAVPDLPEDCVVEIPAVVGKGVVRPLPTAPLPPSIRGLVQAVKAYEELTVKAAVEGDARAALQALLAHTLVPSFSVAKGLWDAIKRAQRAYLPQFGAWA